MTERTVLVDERTTVVENQAESRAYRLMSWLLVLDLGLHGLRPGLADWNGFPIDIAVIILIGGLVATWHPVRAGTLSLPRLRPLVLAALIATLAALWVVSRLVAIGR